MIVFPIIPQGLDVTDSPTFAGATLTGLIAGRIPFAGAGGLISDSAGLTWDNTNYALSVGAAVGGGSAGGVYIYSNDGTNESRLWNANTTSYYFYDEGAFNIKCNTANQNTVLNLVQNGTGNCTISLQGAEFASFNSAWSEFRVLSGASKDLTLFQTATEGETKTFSISGRRTGDSLRTLGIDVGGTYANAADTAGFGGVDNYRFVGTVNAVTAFQVNGTQVLTTQQAHIIDADGTLADITTKFNTLLSELETHGLLAAA